MKKFFELTNEEAKAYFLNKESYFNMDMPPYISFEPILKDVATVLNGSCFSDYQSTETKPFNLPNVNYKFLTNKDGKLAWRPLELIHPVIYVSMVNLICESDHWKLIKDRFSEFQSTVVDCCSAPVKPLNDHSYDEAQIINWWERFEQQSLIYSLEYSHVLHTDVIDCYGSFYTHSIAWALHGLEEGKKVEDDKICLEI